jgi:hypothetical protein
MLRARVRRCTGTTGLQMSVTHGLGTTADVVWWVGRNRWQPGTYLVQNTGANTVHVVNSLNSNATLDVFCWVWQGRLY